MQITLLSGGSGKRLWPLSNNARSKQFLPLLQSPSGDVESMVQRVVRQINESRLSGQITIATNSTQKDIIINQLGEDVDIVTEPERRDTFPAIALAAGYLSMAYSLIDLPVILCRMFCNVMKPQQLYSYLAVGLKRRGTLFI